MKITLRNFLFVSILFLTFSAQATIFKKGDTCYEMKLVGSMIDTLACKYTAVNYRQIDCKTKSGSRYIKVLSKLKTCDPKSVSGILNTKDGDFDWVAHNQSSAGFDIWTLQDPETVQASAVPSTANISKVERKSPTLTESKFSPSTAFSQSHPNLMSKWNLDASWKAGLLSNHPMDVRDVSIFKSQVSFSWLNIGYEIQPIEDFTAKFNLAASPSLAVTMSSPFGIVKTENINLTEAYLQNNRSENFKIKLGWYYSPLSLDEDGYFDYHFSSVSMAQLYMRPFIFSGVSLVNKLSENTNSELFLVNGWNELASINERVTYGGVFKLLKDNFSFRFGLYAGDEGLPTNLVKINLFEASFIWQKMFEIQITSGSLDNGNKFSSYLLQGFLQANEKRKFGLRLENYTNTNAFLISTAGWVSGNSLSMGVYEQINPIVSGNIELEYDQPASVVNASYSSKAQELILLGVDIKL